MIEYVLLLVIVMTMSGMVYLWMKTYVPKDNIQCEDGVSLYITSMSCQLTSTGQYQLNIDLKNSGRFNIRGFFIHATENPSDTIAAVDLSTKQVPKGIMLNEVLFADPKLGNSLPPTANKTFAFILDKKIYSIEISPTKIENVDGQDTVALCGNAKVKEQVFCK